MNPIYIQKEVALVMIDKMNTMKFGSRTNLGFQYQNNNTGTMFVSQHKDGTYVETKCGKFIVFNLRGKKEQSFNTQNQSDSQSQLTDEHIPF